MSETTGLAVTHDSTDTMMLVFIFFGYRYTEHHYSLWIFTHNPYYFLSVSLDVHPHSLLLCLSLADLPLGSRWRTQAMLVVTYQTATGLY